MTSKDGEFVATKYSEATVTKILDTIASTGNDQAACKAAKISTTTFYRWQREKETFFHDVLVARSIYRESQYHERVTKALDVLDQYLLGKAIEIHDSEEEVSQDEDGVRKKKLRREVQKSAPSWVIEKILGKSMNEMEALRVLASAGWIPKSVIAEAAKGLAQLKQSVRHAFENLNQPGENHQEAS